MTAGEELVELPGLERDRLAKEFVERMHRTIDRAWGLTTGHFDHEAAFEAIVLADAAHQNEREP